MLSLKTCRKILDETAVTDEYFLRLHFCIESLFKRLFLIGLRKQGVQYRIAVNTANIYFESPKNFHKRIFRYCGIDHEELSAFGDYAILEDLFFKFTSPHRNKRVHGISDTYTNEEMLSLLINVDKGFFMELESFLAETKGLSFFNTPGKWGANKGTQKDTQTVYEELLDKSLPGKPYTTEEVKERLKKLKKPISAKYRIKEKPCG
jgi:hypothetical protein